MTWRTAVVESHDLAALLERIRNAGGTIACSTPVAGSVRVTWTTVAAAEDLR